MLKNKPGLAGSDSDVLGGSGNLISDRIKLRDKRHFEVKLDYNLDPSIKVNKYKVEAYFFIPRTLCINRETYSEEDFFRNIQSWIRFKTPKISVENLLNKKNSKSPYARVYKLLNTKHKNGEYADKIIRELKILMCVLKILVRDCRYKYLDKIKNKESVIDISVFFNNVELLKKSFEELRLSAAKNCEDVKDAFILADEYFSLIISKNMKRLWVVAEDMKISKKIRKQLFDFVKEEHLMRHKKEYKSVAMPNCENENMSYRKEILRKFFTSVLFLEIKEGNKKKNATHFLYAIAAGIAMFVALIIAIYSQIIYGIQSIAFVVIGVLGYMLKDRMKEGLKEFFNRKIISFFPDRSYSIYDRYIGKKIGFCKESVAFIEEIPKEILKFRNSDLEKQLEVEGKPQEVMKYQKEISLNTELIEKVHVRTKNINDIIKFNVFRLIQRCRDPYYYSLVVDKTGKKMIPVKYAQTYHMNLVFKFSYMVKNVERYFFRRVRVVLDKNGVKRIDDVGV